jgi:thiol-disulfide isomerase/thioredoxin
MIHEVDYSLLNTLTTRHVFVMLYIPDCQSCHLFETAIYPHLAKELSDVDVAFYKSNCEKQTQVKHFPAFILHDRRSNTQIEFKGALKYQDIGKFIRDSIMKCSEARIVPYKRYTGGDGTSSDTPAAVPTELDVFLFDDLKERAIKTDKAFVVLYYADWCPQCTVFKPTFAQYAADNDGSIVGCFKDNGKYTAELFKSEGVVAVPTVKLYYKNETHEHKGAMTLDVLREFVKSRTKTLQSVVGSAESPAPIKHAKWTHPIFHPITENWKDDIEDMRDAGCLVLYYSPSCKFCDQMRSIAVEVAENESRLKVAIVNVNELRPEQRAMLANEDITAVPTIVLYTKYTSFLFDGEHNVQSIGRFIKHRMEQQQQTSNDRRSLLQIQGGGFLKQKSIHNQSLFLFPDNNGMHAKEHRAPQATRPSP